MSVESGNGWIWQQKIIGSGFGLDRQPATINGAGIGGKSGYGISIDNIQFYDKA